MATPLGGQGAHVPFVSPKSPQERQFVHLVAENLRGGLHREVTQPRRTGHSELGIDLQQFVELGVPIGTEQKTSVAMHFSESDATGTALR